MSNQIDKDVYRTLPRWLGPKDQAVLHRVLSAYVVLNPAVGYCQGMNNIAGILVLLGFSEDASLRGLTTLLQKACPSYHAPGLPGYLRDVAVLEMLVRDEQIFPARCYAWLDMLDVPLDVLASEHFLSLASRSWPLDAIVQLWDLIFKEGSSAVFASFLALLQMYLPQDEEQEQSVPGVVESVEPVEMFRRSILRGVTEELPAVLVLIRQLIPKLPRAKLEKLRDEFHATSA